MTDSTTSGPSEIPPELLKRLKAVKGKRARIVIDHILEHGYVTTDELTGLYGYKHAPRAPKDVRDQGIFLTTTMVTSSDGRRIAAYTFDLSKEAIAGKAGGRKQFSKKFKNTMLAAYGARCGLCNGSFPSTELQIDHRVPYEIGGDYIASEAGVDGYMLVCGSCNRRKSWSCEHCPNWELVNPEICQSCYWAYPAEYEHVAMVTERRADIVWSGPETEQYDNLKESAAKENLSVAQYIKKILRTFISRATRLFFT